MQKDPITVDESLCTNCGQCVEVCLGKILEQTEDGIRIVKPQWCNQCGHCVAICPEAAITVGTDPPLPLPDSIPVTPEQMIDHIRARRSVRHFRRQPVPREDLERMIEAARYAPTGSNMQNTCFTVIAAPEKIEAIRRQVLASLEKRVQHWEALAEAHEREGKPIPEELKTRVAVRDRYRNMVEMAKAGRDVIFHQAPALILVHGEPAGVTPKDDADLAAMSILLVAHSMGLGTCLIGLLTAAMAEDRSLREIAELPPGHQVFTSLVLGYPRLQFRRAPGRKPARVRWL